MVEFEIKGLDQILTRMKQLPLATRLKGGRFAMRRAADYVRKEAEKNALRIDDPKTAEKIAKNIVLRFSSRTFKQTGDIMFRVGVLGGARSTSADAQRSAARRRKKGVASLSDLGEIRGKGGGNPGGDTFYWRFVEFGTERAQAKPFMRPALANNAQAATDVFVAQYGKWLDRWARKQGG